LEKALRKKRAKGKTKMQGRGDDTDFLGWAVMDKKGQLQKRGRTTVDRTTGLRGPSEEDRKCQATSRGRRGTKPRSWVRKGRKGMVPRIIQKKTQKKRKGRRKEERKGGLQEKSKESSQGEVNSGTMDRGTWEEKRECSHTKKKKKGEKAEIWIKMSERKGTRSPHEEASKTNGTKGTGRKRGEGGFQGQ